MRSLFFALLLLIPFSVQAQETFTNANCDFEITFPEEYYSQILCQQGAETASDCTAKARYTYMGEDGALSVDAVCVPSSPDLYDTYNQEALAIFTGKMLEENGIDVNKAEFSYDESVEKRVKNSAAFAEGMSGEAPMLFIVQLWFSENSILTTEIKLVGQLKDESIHAKAAEIMNSISLKEKAPEIMEPAKPELNEDQSPASP
ncbi:MAG: hypothetical protein CMH30_07455 [Micavibrio sp.]|nr:hypothetical protein [Micavibrio sp.]|tara:strand:- start:4458 stop:5066 length:609 start_codon:yes stop_codon:yes gene_type:complete